MMKYDKWLSSYSLHRMINDDRNISAIMMLINEANNDDPSYHNDDEYINNGQSADYIS